MDERRLGEILIENGWLRQDHLEVALGIQSKDGRIIGDILIEQGFVSKQNLYRGLAIQSDMAYVDLEKIHVTPEAMKLIPKRVAYANLCIPLFTRDEYFLVAISDPRNAWVEGELRELIHGFKIRTGIAPPEEIRKALEKYYGPEGV